MRDSAAIIKCDRCGELKPAGEFAWKRKERNQRDSFCRPCRAAYGREHYLANKARYIEQAAARSRVVRLEWTRLLLEYFVSHPCVDCGESDPVVLEFDHLGDKKFNIGGSLIDKKLTTILAEIEKCEVVCANCHRRRTAQRRGSFRYMLKTAMDEAGGGN